MKSPPISRALPLIALLIAGMAAFAPGCGSDDPGNTPSPGGSGGTGAGGSGGSGGTGGSGGEEPPTPCTEATENDVCDTEEWCLVEDGQTEGICVPNCIHDSQCELDSQRCDDTDTSATYGRCIDAEPCQGDFTCGTTAGYGDYCGEPGSGGCVCVPSDEAPDNMIGFCRRRAEVCAPCESDVECGNDRIQYDDPRECKPFTFDGETGVNVCLPKKGAGNCPPGTIPANPTTNPELAGYCVPQSQDCADMKPCREDLDCAGNPQAPICDRSRQICVPGCTFDYDDDESVGCAPGLVCHPVPSNLNPELLAECATVPAFGQGKCGAQCDPEDASTCSEYDGGTGTYECVQESSGERRCRPRGCLNDLECPETPGSVYLGYCDIKADPTQNTCVYDTCRPGMDPRAGCGAERPYEDCNAEYKCVAGAGGGTCVEKNCIDKGGAGNGCRLGEFCAGEPMINMLTLEVDGAMEPPPNVPAGECYGLDMGTWCETGCNSSADCTAAQAPYSYPDSPGICTTHPDRSNKCTWGCEYTAECPGRWQCNSRGLEVECADPAAALAGLKRCTTNADCGGGNNCVEPTLGGRTFTNWGNMVPFKVCECSATDNCGAGFECNAGLGTMGTAPSEPATYEKRFARYCVSEAAADVCGENGSCEWMGHTVDLDPMDPNNPLVPRFLCANNPEGSGFPGDGTTVNVTCPTEDGSGNPARPGKQFVDQYLCVISSICKPEYYLPEGSDTPTCGVWVP